MPEYLAPTMSYGDSSHLVGDLQVSILRLYRMVVCPCQDQGPDRWINLSSPITFLGPIRLEISQANVQPEECGRICSSCPRMTRDLLFAIKKPHLSDFALATELREFAAFHRAVILETSLHALGLYHDPHI